MDRSNKKLLYSLTILICLTCHSFEYIFAQGTLKTIQNNNHFPDNKALFKDTFSNKEYEIVYDTLYVTGDTIRKFNTKVVVQGNKLKPGYSFDLSFSPFYSVANISPQSETYAQYAFKRQSAQSPLLSYRAGGNFMLQLQQHSISFGLGMVNFREKQDYNFNGWKTYKTNYTKLDTISNYIIVKGTDTSTVYVTKLDQHTRIDSVFGQNKNSFKNHYLYFEIPVIYGYKKDFGKLSLYFRAGLVFNFLVNVSGNTLSINNYNEFINIRNEASFRDINISLWLGAAIFYPLNNRFNLILEPHYLNSFMSAYRSDYAISQKQQSFGLRLGLSYNLF
jgi:hypothetical protein